MPDTPTQLVVTRVARRFGRRRVLRDVSFGLTGGEIVGLLGPNGSGKTTLLGVLSTLAEPTSGTVSYPHAGGLDTPLRLLGVLGHEPQLYAELTARENLELFARLSGVGDPRAAAERALANARLTERADEPVERFSRGMRQRLAFERVLLHDPRVLLLDEPFTGLDEESVRRMIERLTALRASGVLVLLATHDLALVDGLLDRAFVVHEGTLTPLPQGTSVPDAYRAALASPVPASSRMAATSPAPSEKRDPSVGEVVRAAWVLFQKDLRVEWRSREGLLTTAFFALACVLVFSFGLVRGTEAVPEAGPAVLWITLALAGTLAMARTFERERAAGTLMAVLASPVPRASIYLGKWAALVALMFAVEVALVPLVGLFFQLPLDRSPGTVAALLVAGTVGYAAVGTLFASMLARTRTRDVLLPLLLYPMTVPVLIAGVRGTSAALYTPDASEVVGLWLRLLVSFDAVFVTLALWTFGAVMTEAAPRVAPSVPRGTGNEG